MAVDRQHHVAIATKLRAKGLLYREIADVLGVSVATAHEYVRDPTRANAQARREQYRGVCSRCGSATDGSRGAAKAPKLCGMCYREAHAWTPQDIMLAIRRWNDAYGEPPRATNWNVSQSRRLGYDEAVARYAAGRWPASSVVLKHFGSWNRAIRAAGFKARPVGRPRNTSART